jgi:signal transduction histidine kinase
MIASRSSGGRDQRRVQRTIIVIASLLVAFFAAVSVVYVQTINSDTRSERKAILNGEAQLVESEIEARLTALLAVMASVRERALARDRVDGLRDFMTRLAAGISDLRTIIVADSDGVIRSDLRAGEPAKGIDVSDRDYVAHHAGQSSTGLFFGIPVVSRVDQSLTLPMSLPIRGADGALFGVVAGSVDHKFMRTQLEMPDRELRVLLVHDNGRVFGLERSEVEGVDHPSLDQMLQANPGYAVLIQRPLVAPGLMPDGAGADETVGALPVRVMIIGPRAWEEGDTRRSAVFASGFFLVASGLVVVLAWVSISFVRQQRKARKDVNRVSRSLQEAERLSNIGTWRWDFVHDSEVWSQGTFDIVGMTPMAHQESFDEASFKVPRAHFTKLVHPDDRPLAMELVTQAIKTGRPYSQRYRLVRPDDGRVITVQSNGYVEADEDGNPARMYGLVRDVTEELAVIETLERARESAEAGLRAREDFIAMISHEIRTPLNAIMGFSHLIVHAPDGRQVSEERRKSYLEGLEEASQNILSLVDQVLDLSRLRSDVQEEARQRVPVAEIVNRTSTIIAAAAEQKSIRLELEVDETVHISGEIPMIDRALLNLFSNAIKFSPANSTLKVTVNAVSGRARIAVSDEGPGIAEADIKRLAQPFVRLEQPYSPQTQGTGLGLAITKLIMDRHDGALVIKSVVGQGTTVMLEMPLDEA